MRSLADRVRLERVVRAIALVSLALWIVNTAWPRHDRAAVIRGPSLGDVLPRLTTAEPADSIHAQVDTVPDARTAAWLAAFRGAGVGVSWSGATGAAIALETFRSPDPAAGIVLLAAAPGATSIVGDAPAPLIRSPARARRLTCASRPPRAKSRCKQGRSRHVWAWHGPGRHDVSTWPAPRAGKPSS